MQENTQEPQNQEEFNGLRMSIAFKQLREIRIKIIKSKVVPVTQQSEIESTIGTRLTVPTLKKSKSDIKRKCKLCFEYKINTETPRFMDCDHKPFCLDCSTDFLKMKILDRQPKIECEMKDCNGKFQEKSVIFENLDEKLKRIHKRNYLQIVEKYLSCKVPDCNGLFTEEIPCCTECKKEHCRKCLEVRHQGICRYQQFIKPDNIKQCPICKILIQKIQGCNHIICPCKHQFCFICQQKWSKKHHLCTQKTKNLSWFKKFTSKLSNLFS